MYYHLIMEDGLKYKDLSIEELEKIINEEEVSYNNSRVYSSEKKLNQIFEMYKDDLNEQQNDVNLENIVDNLGGLIAIIIGLIFTQIFYNFFRRLSYNKFKDF